MRAVVGGWLKDVPIRVACDVRNPLLGERGAARVFGPQKGADADDGRGARGAARRAVGARARTATCREPARAAGSGAAFAALGGELLAGAELVLDLIGFDERARDAAVVVTGEGTVDATTLEGKAPGAVRRRCERLGVRCELFGGIVRDGIEAHALSGRRALAGEDLVQLGEELALALVGRA